MTYRIPDSLIGEENAKRAAALEEVTPRSADSFSGAA